MKIDWTDRRIVILITFAICTIFAFQSVDVPLGITMWVQDFHDEVEKYGPGSKVLVVNFCDPRHLGDVHAGLMLSFKYAKQKEWKLIIYSMRSTSDIVQQKIFRDLYGSNWGDPSTGYGTEWVYLGYLPGGQASITTMCEEGVRAYRSFDIFGTPLDDMPVADGFGNAEDWDLVLGACCATGYQIMPITKIQYGVPFVLTDVAGGAAMLASDYLAGNIAGILPGVKGAAEFEKITGINVGAMRYAISQIALAVFAIFGIAVSNIYYLVLKPRAERAHVPDRMEEAG